MRKIFLFIFIVFPNMVTAAEEDINLPFSQDSSKYWQYISDRTMGGISDGQATLEQDEEMFFARLKGNVSTKNNGGFIQLRAGVNLRNKNIEGIRIKVRGNNNEYYLHLRSPRMLPWNYYTAKFYASEEWVVVDLPLSSFEYSRDTTKSFNSSKIQSIGLVAYGKDFFAQVDLAEVELY